MLKEAKRQRLLKHLREVHNKREKQKPENSRLEKPASSSKNNTSTATGFPTPSRTVSNTDCTKKEIKGDKMPIYIYNPSPASLKRKAEKVDDGFNSEQVYDPRQGRETKKAKPTSGYVSGTGKPYRGTARERPNSPPLGVVGILGSKSANVPSKRRETVANQDTKNLNRNARKAKLLDGKSTSRQSQGSLKVAEPEAIDDGTTKRLQHTERDASRVAELGTMEDVKHQSLQASKRKRGHNLETETRKKPKIDPNAVSSVRELKVGMNTVPQARTSSFFAHIQRPGHTAAIPTNVKHVQEVIKEPTPKLPKTHQKNLESGEAGALGKKRQREEDAGSERTKKAKLSTPGSTRRKSSSIEKGLEQPPKGLRNRSRACFANASLQCLFGVTEFLAHYKASRKRSPEEVPNAFMEYTNLPTSRKAMETVQKKREQLRSAVAGECLIGAHLSELARDYRKSRDNPISPNTFLDACGVIFRDEENLPLNGETPQDATQFISELLQRLHDEEIMECTEAANAEKSSFIRELLHVQGVQTLECKTCGKPRDSPYEPAAGCYGWDVVLPTSEEATTLGELLKRTRASELLAECLCEDCKRTHTTTQTVSVERLPKYLIVRAPRTRHMVSRRQSFIQKIQTSVEVPAEALDLSFLLKENKSKKAHPYEVFGIVEHIGKGYKDGHYVAYRKFQGNWYYISDAEVEKISDKELPTKAHIFFLRRVE